MCERCWPAGGGGGGYSWGFVAGSRPVLQILTLFQTKKIVISHTRFQTWPLKSRSIFRPGVGRNYVIITYFRMPTRIFLKIHFEFAYYSFFLIHLELKRQTHSCTPVENHTRIQTKTGKVYPPVSDQNGAKTIPFKAAYTYMANVRENPSPRGGNC